MRKKLLPIIALVLSVIMSVYCVSCTTDSKTHIPEKTPEVTPTLPEGSDGEDSIDDYPTIPKSVLTIQSTSASSEKGPEPHTIYIDELESFDVDYKTDVNEGLKSYSVIGGIDVAFDTSVDIYSIIDAITVDDTIALEQVYYQTEDSELQLGEIYSEYYEVEIDYTDSGKVQAIYYLDNYYIYNYDSFDRLESIYKNSQLYKSIAYNDNGKVLSETNTDLEVISYGYTSDGNLFSVNNVALATPTIQDNDVTVGEITYIKDNNLISQTQGGVVASFAYDYTFNDISYLTSKTVDGEITKYRYLGDKAVTILKGNQQINYILDNNLNYIGLKYNDQKYYFDVDPFGNVLGLFDCDGNYVVEYQYDVWGTNLTVSGTLSDSLGSLNEVLNLNAIYDASLNAYFMGEQLYLPGYGIVIMGDSTYTAAKSIYEWEQNSYFTRSAVTDFARIHDKVVSVVVENFKEAGLDVVSNLYAIDDAGNTKRLVDIYTLDYSITPFSAMNLVDGNQVYEVIYHSPDSMAFESIAEGKLKKIAKEWTVSYFADYKATPGTMKFNGQFIYCGYLIDYKCDGAGIVEYQVKNNKKSNYNQNINIFDFDQNKYLCYVDNTFNLDFLDGVTIIPGISKETFDVIDNYLADYLQAVTGDICDQMLIYDDPSYYDMENMNVYPDYWAQMNLNDPTTYLEIQKDGSVQVKTMPVWETDGFATKILIGAGVILVTAVVATIAISIPGLNCVVVSICVGAAKGAIAGALSGFAFGAVSGAAGEFISQVASGQTIDFMKIANAAAGAAADGFMTGAITGAIMGGIQGGLNPTYCFEAGTPVSTAAGTVAIENVSVGNQVWSYDYITGQKSLKTVTATSVRQTNEIIKIAANGEEFVTTPRHPFYVVNDDKFNGYTAAEYLSVGDCILTADGDYAIVTSVEKQTLNAPINVYNFTVEDNHSYYVGESAVLVHNAACSTPSTPEGRAANIIDNLDNAKVTEIGGKPAIEINGVKYQGGRVWENRIQPGYQNLPTTTTYVEYDINPFVTNRGRGLERLVIGADGSKWLTVDHYKTFTRIG